MNNAYQQIPSVNQVMQSAPVKALSHLGTAAVTALVRQVVEDTRQRIRADENNLSNISLEGIADQVVQLAHRLTAPSLKGVINATGVVIHTNLGRAPLGTAFFDEMRDVVTGYNNLEYDLKRCTRGSRGDHIIELLKFLTGADDALVVNNNAAAVLLAINTLAGGPTGGKEVIVSRGELVEIGGSFRIPEIIAASGAKMVEVGTTNKTHLRDYENAISDNTAVLLKVHRANYDIVGFTEEVEITELAALSRKEGLVCVYDIGSGLLRKPAGIDFGNEPVVKDALADGADIVTFSGDKLLGGPQCGMLAGDERHISLLRRAPMHRALRVGKLTIAALFALLKSYLNDDTLKSTVPVFACLGQSLKELEDKANALCTQLAQQGVGAQVVESEAQTGGGTLPRLTRASFAVQLVLLIDSKKERKRIVREVFEGLHRLDRPVIGIMRQGELVLDVMALDEAEFPLIAGSVAELLNGKIG